MESMEQEDLYEKQRMKEQCKVKIISDELSHKKLLTLIHKEIKKKYARLQTKRALERLNNGRWIEKEGLTVFVDGYS